MAVEINRDNYIVVQGWMISELGLKGARLLIYAIIYGFSQGDQGEFSGSLGYLEAWTKSTKKTVIESLKELEDRGLITKSERFDNGVKKCKYRCKNYTGGGVKTSPGECKNFPEGGVKITPNNIDINSIDTILRKYSLGRFTETLKKALADWLKYKSERKDKYTETELENLVAQIEKAAAQYGDTAMADVISRSIASGYKGIVFDWLKKSGTQNKGAASREPQDPDWMKRAIAQQRAMAQQRRTAGEDPAIKARAEQLQRDLRGGS